MEEGFPQDLLIPREEWRHLVQDMIQHRQEYPEGWHVLPLTDLAAIQSGPALVRIMNEWPATAWPAPESIATRVPLPESEGSYYCWKYTKK